MQPDNIRFMNRAIELARNGIGLVSPNPMVGCVICKDNIIIGEGWHRKFGEKHAEVNAIESVKNQEFLKSADMYVTLEPCSHFGKTPPCSDFIISKEVKRIFVSMIDPNPIVSGNGISKLKNSGIEVSTGLAAAASSELNKRYITAIIRKRPYIILKWAQTMDGFIASENYESKWISNELSRQMAHQWRANEDAVLVGFRTAKYDNPYLNVRNWVGRNPIRIIFDKKAELNPGLHVFDKSQKTIIYNLVKEEHHPNLEFIKIDETGFVKESLSHLVNYGIHSVIIEGGSSTHGEFIRSGLWDEARIFVSPLIFNRGIRATQLTNSELIDEKKSGSDFLFIYRNKENSTLWLNH
jgi:diaminohydroxyphosphoribosylaminopyrimidine deaminase / 5-amino-6-(5-phosphoribosylamino)uracil reductase